MIYYQLLYSYQPQKVVFGTDCRHWWKWTFINAEEREEHLRTFVTRLDAAHICEVDAPTEHASLLFGTIPMRKRPSSQVHRGPPPAGSRCVHKSVRQLEFEASPASEFRSFGYGGTSVKKQKMG